MREQIGLWVLHLYYKYDIPITIPCSFFSQDALWWEPESDSILQQYLYNLSDSRYIFNISLR